MTDEPVAGTTQSRAEPSRGVASRVAEFLLRKPESTIAIVGVALVIYFTATNDAFFTSSNARIITQYVISVAILAVGQTMLLICGEIDLSLGSVYFMTPFLVHFGLEAGIPLPLAILLALLGAGMVGVFNGAITITFGIPSFIVTLGTLLMVGGLTLNLSDGFPKRAPSTEPPSPSSAGRSTPGSPGRSASPW